MDKIVTVAIALCNNAQWIQRCIDSVLAQTYKNIEIIVIDDGSTDGSGEICKRYQQVKYIWKENGGLSSARQKGLELATGEYICFIDADDYLADTYVEHLIKKSVSTSSDICVCSTKFVTETGEEIVDLTKAYHCNDGSVIQLSEKTINTNIVALLLLSDSWDKMYKREFIEKCKVSFSLPKGFNGSDLAFNNKLALFLPSYSFVSSCEYIHVIYKQSAVHRKRKKYQEGFEIIIDDIIRQSQSAPLSDYSVFISNLYYRLLRKSIQDVVNENKETKEKGASISEMMSRHRTFVRNRAEIKGRYRSMFSKSLLVFAFLSEYIPALIRPYLLLRRRMTSSDAG